MGSTLRKLILHCGYSAGDIVMLTAAVRDLHVCYPGQFVTDVRTPYPEIWENNPHITPLDETEAEVIECSYPLIDRCNVAPNHCLAGFVEFLNQELGLSILTSDFRGDIHLSDSEKYWFSQVHELTGEDTPFWIVAAGGKFDATVKWWPTSRYQAVIDHFRGRILFVQVGAITHHHPKIHGAVDLRGQTTMRELIRLVYHAQGVLCPITSLMHLAASVETKPGRPERRPCVVVAGGREPPHWEAYPWHQFIHTVGGLECCAHGGCWRDRTIPLGDGDERDDPEHLCAQPVNDVPACMDLIRACDVTQRIDLYLRSGAFSYLSPIQARAAKRGVRASAKNWYDDEPLTLQNARAACEAFIAAMPSSPPIENRQRGIVICGGNIQYFTNAWVCIHMLRGLGCHLPIELWHRGDGEMDSDMRSLVQPLDVRCVDALPIAKENPPRRLGGWGLKAFALVHSSFAEVLLLDADNVPVKNPQYLFETIAYQQSGALFWPDFGRTDESVPVWRSCGLEAPSTPEFESGQIMVDRRRCWKALRLALWFNEHQDFYYRYIYGDKETFHLAFKKLGTPFTLIPHPIHRLEATMCQHDPDGHRLFQHRNTDKWNLFLRNRTVEDFWFEPECRQYVQELARKWDGRASRFAVRKSTRSRKPPSIAAVMISCRGRRSELEKTLASLHASDWTGGSEVVQDESDDPDPENRQTQTAFTALKKGLEANSDLILFLEDDLRFNRHLLRNLRAWAPLRERALGVASLYNPGVGVSACHVHQNWIATQPEWVYGSQALLLSRRAAEYILRRWDEVDGKQDIKISRLAKGLKRPIYYHSPSLVQHVGKKSTWGGGFHTAIDFDRSWRAQNC